MTIPGDWDEVCIICAICPSGGPCTLVDVDDDEDLEDTACRIAKEVKANLLEERNEGESIDISDEELQTIVTEALASSLSGPFRNDGLPEWLPEGLGAIGSYRQKTSRDCVAIGYFGERDGRAPIRRDQRFPDGQNVETRHVRGLEYGNFDKIVRHGANGEMIEEDTPSVCSVGGIEAYSYESHHPNFWLCKECYQCLHGWMKQETVSTKEFSDEELYEVVHSQSARRSGEHSQTLRPTVVLTDSARPFQWAYSWYQL